jgi:hypothetical protein
MGVPPGGFSVPRRAVELSPGVPIDRRPHPERRLANELTHRAIISRTAGRAQTAAVVFAPGINSGYILARMRCEVVLAPQAAKACRSLPAYRRAEVRDALERHFRHEPNPGKQEPDQTPSRAEPAAVSSPGWGSEGVHDVTREAVEVLAIVTKAEAARWLAEHGTSGAPGGAR